jgi:type II secretory pathway pseudopilin PulG
LNQARAGRRSAPGRTAGFTYLGVLFLLAILGVGAAAAAILHSLEQRRAREAELLFAGDAYRRAITAYHSANAAAPAPYPRDLSSLLRDPNALQVRRFLRRLYPDPMTGGEWGLVRDAQGGIRAVYSLASGAPIKRANFAAAEAAFAAAKSYADWRFGDTGDLAATTPTATSASAALPPTAAGGLGSTEATAISAPTSTTASGPPRERGLRTNCEDMRLSDQGACSTMAFRQGSGAAAPCFASAAARASACAANPNGPFPGLQFHN